MGSRGLNLGQVFNQFFESYQLENQVSPYKQKVASDIMNCKTQNMGGHWKVCTHCGDLTKHYNSCGNRHCPTCQGINKEKWLLERKYDLLPVKYFHVVFTLPAQLRGLFIQNQQLMYNLLFRSAWITIDTFAMDPRQRMVAKAGMIAILHTWTQKLLYHPHLHCIVPYGGIDKQNRWKTSKGNTNFLFYVPNVAQKFKGLFLHELHNYYINRQLQLTGKLQYLKHKKAWTKLKDSLYKINWVVNCKEPFKGPDSVYEYLGRYTHKIAISNYRIKKISATHVGFTFRDRADGDKEKYLEIPGEKFIQRFLMHVVPKRFIRIRHYGFLATRVKKKTMPLIRSVLKCSDPGEKPKYTVRQVMQLLYGIDINLCQSCKKGLLLVINKWEKSRAPPNVLAQLGIVV